MISPVLIGHQLCFFLYKLLNPREKFSSLNTVYQSRAHRTLALVADQHRLLVGAYAAFVFNIFFIAGFTAKVFFIQLDNAAQRRLGFRSPIKTEDTPLLEFTIKYIHISHFHKGSLVLSIGVCVVTVNCRLHRPHSYSPGRELFPESA